MQLAKIYTANEIAQRLTSNASDLAEIAKDIASAVDVNPNFIKELQSLGVARDLVLRLERFGRGQIHQRLFAATSAGAIRIIHCSLSEQTDALENGVEVLDADETTVRRIPLHELSTKQAVQTINGQHIRSIGEQRTYLRDRKPHLPAGEPEKGYIVKRGLIETTRPMRITREILVQWLAEVG
jgi:hypothetical protein